MSKRKTIFISVCISVIAVCCVICCTIFLSHMPVVAANYVFTTEVDLTVLDYGSSFTLPEEVDVIINDSTTVKSSDSKLKFPSGIVYGMGSHVLNEAGE